MKSILKKLIVVLQLFILTNPIYYLYSHGQNNFGETNFQISWDEAIILSENDNIGSHEPSIAVDSKNNVHVVWHDESDLKMEIFYRKYDFSEKTWLDIEIISNTSVSKNSKYPVIKVDKQDFLHVIWRDSGTPVLINYIYFNGVTWSIIQPIANSTNNIFSHDLVPLLNNQIFFIWTNEQYELFYRCFSFITSNWTNEKQLTNTISASINPKLIADTSNNVHLVWSDSSVELTNNEVHYQYFNGEKWLPEKPLIVSTIDDISVANPSIQIDQEQRIHIIWHESSYPIEEIHYRTFFNNVLSEEFCISNKSNLAQFPAFTIDKRNNLHFVWGEDLQLKFRYRSNKGKWSEIIPITAKAPFQFIPKISVDSKNAIHIIWNEYRGSSWEVYYIKGNYKIVNNIVFSLMIFGIIQIVAFLMTIIIIIFKKKSIDKK